MPVDNYWTNRFTRRATRRRLLGGGGALGLGLLAAACGGINSTSKGSAGTSAAASGKQPKRGGTLRWGNGGEPASLDPVWTTQTAAINLATNLYDTLLAYDVNLKPQPVLLKDYAVSADKLTYTFNLREDSTFEGGRPITSADVVASIERWGRKAPAGVTLLAAVNSLQAKDANSFVLETKEPYSLVIDSLALGGGGPFIMTKEAASTPVDRRVDDVTASGPFKLAEWTKGNKLVLKARADYKGPAGPASNTAGTRTVYVDTLEVEIIPEQNSRLSALQAGTIDVMYNPPADYFDQLKSNPQIDVKTRDGGYDIILLNHTRPPFSNLLARQALLAAADADKFMTAGNGKLWKACGAIFLCGTPNESKASVDQYNQRNLTKAKQLFLQLQQSGGYDGRTLIALSDTTNPVHLNESQVTKQMLESIGFRVDLQTPDFATAVSMREDKSKWDLFHTNTVNGPGANDPLRSLPLSPAWYGWYQSAEMQDLQHQYSLATTPEQQKAAIDKVQALWYKDVPHLLLGIGQPYDAYRTYVKGYSNYPSSAAFWNVWLDK